MAEVRLHPEAKIELQGAIDFYDLISTDLGDQFLLDYISREQTVAENPDLYSLRAHGARRVNLKDFPYYLPYIVLDDVVWIVAVAHAKKKPLYWKTRLL